MTAAFSTLTAMHASLKPRMAAALGTAATTGNFLVWMESIKGWAATVTVLIGAPTAILMFTYWFLKVRSELRKKDVVES